MSMITVPDIIYPPVRAPFYSSARLLDAADEFTVCVLKINKSGTLNKIVWQTGTISGTSYTLKISVEVVGTTVGQPVATTNAGKTLFAMGAESADITSLSSNTIYHTPINGTTGISVSEGNSIAVTFRLTEVSSSSVNIICIPSSIYGFGSEGYPTRNVYTATYLGGSWTLYPQGCYIGLEYSDGFVPLQGCKVPSVQSGIAYNSGSSNVYVGVKFKFPYQCRLAGVILYIDIDAAANLYLYDSDEYTALSGFPIAIDTKRAETTSGNTFVPFPTKPTLNADTWYRLIIVPTTTTSITIAYATPSDDGSVSGMTHFSEGANFLYTYRAGAPSSGDHTWTDENRKPILSILVDGIEISSGSGSGISRTRQVMG